MHGIMISSGLIISKEDQIMSDLEHVIKSFKLSKAGGDIPAEYDPELWLKVYDTEEDNVPATITNITRCPDNNIAIEFKYDGYTRTRSKDETACYPITDEVDIELPLNDGNLQYDLLPYPFGKLFITEYRLSQFRDKIWPTRLIRKPDPFIHLEYVETVDTSHANYKIMCYEIKDGIITLSREDIREFSNDALGFLENMLYLIGAMKDNTDGFEVMFDAMDDYEDFRERMDQDETQTW